jgi:hypothetical protein
MDCIECKATNPDGNCFCGQCGAELGRTLDETVRKKGFRDRLATEMEITASVAERLMKWASWLGRIAVVIGVLFALLFGKGYWDVWAAVEKGKTEIETSIQRGKKDIETSIGEAKKEIEKLRQTNAGLEKEGKEIRADIERYRKLNVSIEALQKQIVEVQRQVVDLGERGLRAKTVETTGPGPFLLSVHEIGCPPSVLAKGAKVAYCVQDSPLSLYQRAATGELRPVSSLSPVGFQDVSTAPKPTCTAANRGTFYVEKGTGKVADKPFLCVKKSDNTYDWIQLSVNP